MEPKYIFFNELELDSDPNFSLNFEKKRYCKTSTFFTEKNTSSRSITFLNIEKD